MKINLNTLNKPYEIDKMVIIPAQYYQNTLVKKITELNVQGKIYYDLIDEVKVKLKCKGAMVLEDSNTLEELDYPFSFEIDDYLTDLDQEIVKKTKNKQMLLDIEELLWENIILEVPISVTNHQDINLKGNGWELNKKKS